MYVTHPLPYIHVTHLLNTLWLLPIVCIYGATFAGLLAPDDSQTDDQLNSMVLGLISQADADDDRLPPASIAPAAPVDGGSLIMQMLKTGKPSAAEGKA